MNLKKAGLVYAASAGVAAGVAYLRGRRGTDLLRDTAVHGFVAGTGLVAAGYALDLVKVDVPILGIVENMSYFVCPHCGGRTDVFAHGGARQEAAKLGVPFLGEIPLDIAIRETSDGGNPIVASEPDGPHAESYRNIARAILDQIAAPRRATPKFVVE